MSDGGILDAAALAALEEMVGGDPEFVAEMIATYLDETPGLIEEMRASLISGDAAQLRRAAHTLKSNSATFGATALADLCQRLEALGKDGEFAGVDRLVDQSATEYARVADALNARLGA